MVAFALGLASGSAGQTPYQEFETPDGSRIVLVPTTAKTVYWVLATPCSPLDDERGFEGLAAAVLQDSMNGTRTIGSRNPSREATVARQLSEVKVRIANALLAQEAPAPDDGAALQALTAEAAQLRDVGAFRRLLVGAPATQPALAIRDGVATLTLRTDSQGIRRVAELLQQRREEAALYGADTLFAQAKIDKADRWGRQMLAPLLGEAATLAFGADELGRWAGAPTSPRVAPRAQIRAVWERTQHPSRSVHVLVGGFDPETITATLQEVFAETALPRPATPPPQPRPDVAARRGVLVGAKTASVAIVLPLPQAREEVRALAGRWLHLGRSGALTRNLRRAGLKRFRLNFTAPFPGEQTQLSRNSRALITIQLLPGDPNAKKVGALMQAVNKAFAICAKGPAEQTVDSLNAAQDRRHQAAQRTELSLASLVARGVSRGITPERLLGARRAVTSREIRDFLVGLFEPKQRIVVEWRPGK